MAEEQKTAGGQSMENYWKNAWQEACDRERAIGMLARQRRGEIDSLKTGLNSMRAQRDRVKKESARRIKEMESDIRELCDEFPYDENKLVDVLRQYVWNDDDLEAQIKAEGHSGC